LGKARGTAASVYLKDALELVRLRLNLEKPRVGDRVLLKYIFQKEVGEIVDGKGRRWRLVELKLVPAHPKRGSCTRALYARVDWKPPSIVERFPKHCPLHPSKLCALARISDETASSPVACAASRHSRGEGCEGI
jgi:hypothetical protein